MSWTVTTEGELDALPVGSIVVDLGKGGTEADAPVVACKAERGDWGLLGDDPDRRWWGHEMLIGARGTPLTVVYAPGKSLTVPIPRVAPMGWEVDDAEMIQEVWDTFVKPDQDAGNVQSAEMRVLMAVLRAVYTGLAEQEPKTDG